MRRLVPALACSTLLLATLLACKRSKPSTEGTPPVTGSGAPSTASTTTPSSPGKYISDLSFATVCNEAPMADAKAYDGAVGSIHPTLVFTRTSADQKYTKSYDNDFDGWKTDEARNYELVACVTTKKATKVKECKFDAKTPVRYLDLEDATFEVAVYEAKTGKQLGTKTLESKVDQSCPMFWMFKSEHDKKQAEFAPGLMAWAKQYVAPKAGGATEEPAKAAAPGAAVSKPATAKTEAAKTPAKTEPAKTPAKTEPAKTPAKTEPAKTPAKTTPAKTPPKKATTDAM